MRERLPDLPRTCPFQQECAASDPWSLGKLHQGQRERVVARLRGVLSQYQVRFGWCQATNGAACRLKVIRALRVREQ